MIVLGADTKSSHTIAAVDTATGQVLGDKSVPVGSRGFAALVLWARGLDGERVWALEDCRHVSGALERFLIARGERVVRVKVVFSASLEAVDWPNASVNARPVEEEIPRLKTEPGGDIVVFGGPSFAHSLIRHHLVDEYRLTVHPIALGHGSALLHGLPEPQRFELVSSTVYTDGSTLQVLQPNA